MRLQFFFLELYSSFPINYYLSYDFYSYYNTVYDLLSNLKKTEESSKIMKRKGKSSRSLASSLFSKNMSSDALDDNNSLMSVEDKIRMQILLDVKHFGIEVGQSFYCFFFHYFFFLIYNCQSLLKKIFFS